MGEAADNGVMQTEEKENEEEEQSSNHHHHHHHNEVDDHRSEAVVRWERFLPRMVLRVLLIEPDDSTRQIVSALLRKCCYKVAAVHDGLKAWETVKSKAPDIDLILTEVELPSISGFSLLTLIMEHDICKNIPVIMMSSHDSVSMVFKCMLKGAADFLIKPVRRNELRNLWQHVWRRHAVGSPPQNLTLPPNKHNVAAENNSESNHSSGSVASTQDNNKSSEKTTEAQELHVLPTLVQNTCTSPFLEAESAYMQNMQETSQLKSSSNLSNFDSVKHEKSTEFERESAKNNDEAGEAARFDENIKPTRSRLGQGYDYIETKNQDEVLRTELSEGNPHINAETHEFSNEMEEPSNGAIDLITTIDNLPKSTVGNCSSNVGVTANFDFDTQLELSLRRDFPASSCKSTSEERQILNHSNASAFSWYNNIKFPQPLLQKPSTISAKLTNASQNSHESHKLSENTNISHHGSKHQHQERITTLVIGRQVDPKLPNSQLGFFPANGVTPDPKSVERGNVFVSMLHTQSGVHPICTPKAVCQKESSPFPTSTSTQSNNESHSAEHHHWVDDATFTSDHNLNDKSNLDCLAHDSSTACQCSSTGFYLHDTTHSSNGVHGSVGSGSDGNVASAVVGMNSLESFIDGGHNSHDGSKVTESHRASKREAALTKFRLKRKDRCFEKKVRYQSRKRLAEQRPRVKGQFVRQAQNDNPVADAGGGS